MYGPSAICSLINYITPWFAKLRGGDIYVYSTPHNATPIAAIREQADGSWQFDPNRPGDMASVRRELILCVIHSGQRPSDEDWTWLHGRDVQPTEVKPPLGKLSEGLRRNLSSGPVNKGTFMVPPQTCCPNADPRRREARDRARHEAYFATRPGILRTKVDRETNQERCTLCGTRVVRV